MYRVHIGYTAGGRNRWRNFDTLDAARIFCAAIFDSTRKVLAILEVSANGR